MKLFLKTSLALGVDSVFVGHEHCNSASVIYDGVRFQFGQKSSTYDRFNSVNSSGNIVGDYAAHGTPIIGGTVVTLFKAEGSLKDAYIYLCEEVDDEETEETLLSYDKKAVTVNPNTQIDLSDYALRYGGSLVTSGVTYSVKDMNGNAVSLTNGKFTTAATDNVYLVTVSYDGATAENALRIISRAKRTNGDGSYQYASFGAKNAPDYIDTYMFDVSYETETPATVLSTREDIPGLGMQKLWNDSASTWSYTFLTDGYADFTTAKTVSFSIFSLNTQGANLKIEWVDASGKSVVLMDEGFPWYQVKTLSFQIPEGGTLVGGKLVVTADAASTDLEIGDFRIS